MPVLQLCALPGCLWCARVLPVVLACYGAVWCFRIAQMNSDAFHCIAGVSMRAGDHWLCYNFRSAIRVLF